MGGYAWVTLATNDSYSLGALVLAHSLKQVATQQQLAVLITPGVTNSMRAKLGEIFNVVKEVNILDSKDEANLRLLKRPELGITFTKLHCWRLTQFEKCVFLDADTLVLENCDELFEREELSAAPDIGWPDCFNSGVFVYRPSNETYEKLINFALEKGSFDGGDQGLLNLYFSDWAHKDISKHLPFIYNMASTACYSYLPAFKQYGKNTKIIHFIGSSKPWLQYFNTETKKVHPSEGLQHIEQILQHWWDIFCTLIHPVLSPDMTSHTHTVHGSQSYTSQSISHTSYYHKYEHNPSSHNPETAEDYQNVWDPWEEYDSRQSGNKPPDHVISHISEQSQSSQYHYDQSHHSSEMHVDNHIHTNVEHREPQSHYFESSSSRVEYRAPEPHYDHNQLEKHNHNQHFLGRHSENHNQHHHAESTISNNHSEHKGLDINVHHSEHQRPSHNLVHEVVRQESHNQHQQNLIESHNTNTFSKADDHVHIHHPSVPTFSQPQIPIIHYQPPETPNQDCSSYNTPPDDPRLPDECVATATVSNEITLQSDSNEDSNQAQAGLAGAFASLTLGQPRTPEQQALDDHLRRQGWEVGNIDYLGRDSFNNIWSKICETLSLTPEAATTVEQPQTSPVPEPDKTEPEKPPEESKNQSKLAEQEPNKIQLSDKRVQETESDASAPITCQTQSSLETVPSSVIVDTATQNSEDVSKIKDSTTTSLEESTKPASVQEDKAAKYTSSPEIAKPTSEQKDDNNPLHSIPSELATIKTPQTAPESPNTSETLAKTEIPTDTQIPKSVVEPSKTEQIATPIEAPKTVSTDISKDVTKSPQVSSAESQISTSVETTKTINQETLETVPTKASEVKEIHVETPKTSAELNKPVLADTLTDSTGETSKSTPTESPVTLKETNNDAPTKISKITSTDVEQAPAQTTKTSIEISKPANTSNTATLIETAKSSPEKTFTESAKDLVPETTKVTTTDTTTQTQKSTSTETPKVDKEVSKKVDESVTKKVSKEKQAPETKEVPKPAVQKETAHAPVSKLIEPTPPGSPKTSQVAEPVSSPALPKAELQVENSVPNTPPPAVGQEAASGPTPPPRKSAGNPKKTAGKKK